MKHSNPHYLETDNIHIFHSPQTRAVIFLRVCYSVFHVAGVPLLLFLINFSNKRGRMEIERSELARASAPILGMSPCKDRRNLLVTMQSHAINVYEVDLNFGSVSYALFLILLTARFLIINAL